MSKLIIPPLRILIVEDTAERQKVLKQLYRDHAWILVDSSHRAISLLKSYDFDIVSLDYNIKGNDEGDTVASFLKNSRNSKSRVIIHSMNPEGVVLISKILPEAAIMPVNKMITSNKRFLRLRESLNAKGVNFDWEGL